MQTTGSRAVPRLLRALIAAGATALAAAPLAAQTTQNIPGEDRVVSRSTTRPFVDHPGYNTTGFTNEGITMKGVNRTGGSRRGITDAGIVRSGTNTVGITTFLKDPNRLRAKDFATSLPPVTPAPLPGTADNTQSGIPTAPAD